jgi:hypothetical protein
MEIFIFLHFLNKIIKEIIETGVKMKLQQTHFVLFSIKVNI